MSTRSVVVRLIANVDDYRRGIEDAARDTGKFAEKNRQDMETVGKAGLALGTGLAVGVGLALKKFADFDQAMSNIQAATHESAGAMAQLREAALQAGADTAFSAVEAAEGVEALAKAGVSTEAILSGGLNGALDLAAAGGLAVGEAAEIAATALTQFKLEGSQVPHVADLLAAAAGKAQGGVTDMGMALKQAGLVANQTGLTIEETTAGLASFASAGLIGSDAGTSFKSMLQRLTPQSEEAAAEMERLGISAYDAQGNFIGLEAFAGNLQESMAGLTVEQRNAASATIFGSDAVRAASVLYNEGAEGIANWTDKVNDAGYAQETAAKRLDNLKGDLEQFFGSLETALIRTGEAGDGPARKLVQQATDLVNAYNNLPQSAQSVVFAVGAVGAAASLAAGGFLLLAPRIAATQTALATLATTAPRTTAAMVALGKALGIAAAAAAVAIGVDQLSDALAGAPPGINALTDSLADFQREGKITGDLAKIVGGDFERLAESMASANKNRLLEFANPFGDSDVTIKKSREEIEALDLALAGLVNSGNGVAAARFLTDAGVSAEDASKHFDAYKEAQAGTSAQTKLTADSQDALGDAVTDATGAVVEQTESLSELMEKVRAVSEQVLGLRDASRGYEAALDDAHAALKENGKTLDINTEKGRANEAALDAIASSAGEVLQGMVDTGKPISDVTAKFGQQREALVKAAQGFGMTKAQAEAYADSVLRIPPKKVTDVKLTGADAALAQVDRLRVYLASLTNKTVTVRVDQVLGTTVARPGGGRIIERASGGILPGRPSSVDNMVIAAASGEYVVNAAQTARYRPLLEAINAGRLEGRASGGLVGYAKGGPVSPTGGVSLSVAASALTSVEQIRALVYAWEDYNDQLEQAARRQELVADAKAAKAAFDAAKGMKARTAALKDLNEANAALKEFDAAARADAERAAVERLVDTLEARAEAEEAAAEANRRANAEYFAMQDNMYELGLTSAAEYIEILDRRMDDEQKYSDAWMALWRERQAVMKQQADAEQELTDAIEQAHEDRRKAAEEDLDSATRAQETALDKLNRLLDQERDLRKQQVDVQAKFTEQAARIQAQQVKSEAEYYTRRAALGRSFNEEQQQILQARRDSLSNWARLDTITSPAWGNTVEQLVGNAADQLSQFEQWMDELDAARGRGVSEEVIAALGLDEGPQALGQLRQFNAATVAEIAALNEAVRQRTVLAGQQVSREQRNTYGALGRELIAAQQRYAAELIAVEQQFQAEQQALAEELAAAQQQLLAEQSALAEELASLGVEQGRSYGDALAEGMRSTLPAVRAAAAELQAAVAALAAAQAALAGAAAGEPRVGAGSTGPFRRNDPRNRTRSNLSLSEAPVIQNHTYVVLDGKVIDSRVVQTLTHQRSDYEIGGVRG